MCSGRNRSSPSIMDGHTGIQKYIYMHVWGTHWISPRMPGAVEMFWNTLLSFPRARLTRKKKEISTQGCERVQPEACVESEANPLLYPLKRSCTQTKAWVTRSLPLQRFSSNARLVRTDIRSDTDIVLVDVDYMELSSSSSSSRALFPLHKAACNAPLSRAYSGLRMAMHRAAVDAQGNPSKAILSAERIEHDTQLIKSLEDVLVNKPPLSRWALQAVL